MKKVTCRHRFRISYLMESRIQYKRINRTSYFGPMWVCEKCGTMKKITKADYKKINAK